MTVNCKSILKTSLEIVRWIEFNWAIGEFRYNPDNLVQMGDWGIQIQPRQFSSKYLN
jgi:hypothetical protein